VWAVIDLSSGEVWIAPKPLGSCATLLDEEEQVPDLIIARLDSSLIYVHSCEDLESGRTLDTRHVYVWDRKAPKWLRDEKLGK
jgi:hypothetical protein